jgi:hypothetical protein
MERSRPLKTESSKRWLLPFVGVIWAATLLGGFGLLLGYSSTPGIGSDAPAHWPEASNLQPANERFTLLMFIHPHCSCSHASLAELNRLMARLRGRVGAEIVFEREGDTESEDFVELTLRTQASNVPDALIVEDAGEESHRFGIHTSGATLLYDRSGVLMFAGGLTSERGHEGNSFGQERVISLVTTGNADRSDSPVFGCALEQDQEEP